MDNQNRIKMLESNKQTNLENYNSGNIKRDQYLIREKDIRNRIIELKQESSNPLV